jgi:hypothetical protein
MGHFRPIDIDGVGGRSASHPLAAGPEAEVGNVKG